MSLRRRAGRGSPPNGVRSRCTHNRALRRRRGKGCRPGRHGMSADAASGGQRADSLAASGTSGGTLDCVAALFINTVEFAKGGDARIGFAAPNRPISWRGE